MHTLRLVLTYTHKRILTGAVELMHHSKIHPWSKRLDHRFYPWGGGGGDCSEFREIWMLIVSLKIRY